MALIQPTQRLLRPGSARSAFTYDSATMDSVGNFFIGELERLDPAIHQPLASTTWSRDLPLREDVSAGDDLSSFTRSSFGSVGGIDPDGINWVGDESTSIPRATLDIDKIAQPLRLWGSNLSYTYRELMRSMQLGRPIDAHKLASINLKHQMDIDKMVYVGDAKTFKGAYGLLTSPDLKVIQAKGVWAAAAANSTPAIIQQDILSSQEEVWKNSGYAVCPSVLILPPIQYSLLNVTNSSAGTQSVMSYIKENNPFTQATGRALEILPCKWNVGVGADGKSDRGLWYSKDVNYVRYPLVPMQKSPITYQDMWLRTTYWSLLGQVEFVYPETLGYLDGI